MPDRQLENAYLAEFPRLFRRLAYLLGNRSAAEDVAQDAFIQLYREGPADLRNVGGWLNRVAIRLAYNYLRGERRRRDREERVASDPGIGGAAGASHPAAPSAEDRAWSNIQAEAVHRALQRLNPRDRLALLLRHEGHGYAEVAEAVDVDVSSVGTLLARATRRFAAALADDGALDG